MTDLPCLPTPVYLAKLSKDGEWAELVPSNDWTVEMWEHGTDDVYTGAQMREYGRLCRATAEQAGEVDGCYGSSMEEQAAAWEAVFDTLTEVVPGWSGEWNARPMDRACEAIRKLAKPTQPAATQKAVAWIGDDESLQFDAGFMDAGGWKRGTVFYAAPVSPSREVEALALVDEALELMEIHWLHTTRGYKLIKDEYQRLIAPVQEKAP